MISLAAIACSPKEKRNGTQLKSNDQSALTQINAKFPEDPLRELTTTLPNALGERLSPSLIYSVGSITTNIQETKNPALPAIRNMLAKGDPSSEMVSTIIRIDGDALISMDFTFRSAHANSEKQKQHLLHDYNQKGNRFISLLNNKLEGFEVSITDYQNRKKPTLHACAFDANGIMRIVMFDSGKINSDVLIPTTKSLPPGLLQKARYSLESQKAMQENREREMKQ